MMHRKVLLIVAVIGLFLVPVAAIAAAGFTDVADDDVFKDDIQWLADAGVTRGCNPPTNDMFCPDRDVTREEMAAFMHRLGVMLLPDGTPPVGTTARGTYALGNDSRAAFDSIGWGFEMPGNPIAFFLTKGSAPTAECPGTPADPQAAEGYLCVYEFWAFNVTDQVVVQATTTTSGITDPFGAVIIGYQVEPWEYFSYGTWAITVGTP